MKILIVPQALKGSLDAMKTAQAIAKGARVVFPEAELTLLPIADGGEGTMETILLVRHGKRLHANVTGPLGEPVEAAWGLLEDRTAIIEMATCAGLPLVATERRNPRLTTTYGVGELIRIALDHGCRKFLIGLGGSATNDAGVGMLQALGAHFRDSHGQELRHGGSALLQLAQIDLQDLDTRVYDSHFEAICDVENPFTGPNGASVIYGPQKGASPEIAKELDQALEHFGELIEKECKLDILHLPGAGAAGGMGGGLVAFLKAKLRPGAELVLDLVDFSKHLKQADLVITAEGQVDRQTLAGKSVGTVVKRAKEEKKPIFILAGSVGSEEANIYAGEGVVIVPLPDRAMSLQQAMERAEGLSSKAAERALECFRMGIEMGRGRK